MPRDRYVARQAGAESGTLRTPPLLIESGGLTVNAKVEGELRVRVLDTKGHPVKGFDWSDCPPIRGNAVAHPVRWRKSLEKLRGQPIKLEFALTDGELFAFELSQRARKEEQ